MGNQGRGISPPARQGVQRIEDFFTYQVSFDALLSLTSQDGNIQIQADSDFKWISGTYYATIADAAFVQQTQPIPNVTIQITDSGSGRQLLSAPIPVPSLFGIGVLPFIMPIPRIFKARSNISFTVANFDAAVDYNLTVQLIGTKIFTL